MEKYNTAMPRELFIALRMATRVDWINISLSYLNHECGPLYGYVSLASEPIAVGIREVAGLRISACGAICAMSFYIRNATPDSWSLTR